MPITRSPGRTPCTSAPVSVTTPAASAPSGPASPGYMPRALRTSRKLTPAASTATRICPGASGSSASGCGASTRPSRLPLAPASSRHGSPAGGTRPRPATVRANRPTRSAPSRTTNCSSPVASSPGRPGSTPTTPSSSPSTSRSAKRPGFSDCAERTKPHTAAAARSSTDSPEPAAIALRVTKTRREVSNRSSASHSWTSPSTRPVSSCTAAGASAPAPERGTSTRPSSPVTSAREPAVAPTPNSSTAPNDTHRTSSEDCACASGAAAQSRYSSGFCSVPWWAGATTACRARIASVSTVSTGAPSTSATAMVSEFSPSLTMRARTTEAPPACSDTPLQPKGITT